jgi:flagellar hook-associated protein 2
MTSIQFSGVSSGLDTKSIIDALMQVEQAPLTRLQLRETELGKRKDAITDVRTKFQALLDKLRAFTQSKVGAGMSATSGDPAQFTATATASAIGGTHTVRVDRLATSTVARSTAPLGAPITDGSQALATLPFAGSVTAGTIGVVVDGTITKLTVGDPSTATLDDVGSAIASAIQAGMQASDGAATATYSIVNNRIQVAIAGATGSHTVSFGAGGDSSNALGILGLSMAGGSFGAGGTITGTRSLGVVQANASLGTSYAAIAGTTGTLTINGVAIAWNTTTDSLSTLLSRINASAAGVVVSLDRTTDQLVLTSRTTGAAPIDIRDTGGLAVALHLNPGSTTGQTLGSSALVTVDGTQHESASNAVADVLDGVTLNLVAESTTAKTLTVAADRAGITSALQDVADAYNAVADTIDKYAVNAPNGTVGVLANDRTVSDLLSSVRQLLFTPTTAAGPYNNLAAVGLNSGAVGSAKGTTGRLKVDSAKLNAALDALPAAVANLLGPSGAFKAIVDRVNAYAGPTGVFAGQLQSMTAQASGLRRQESDLQDRIDRRRAALEAKYAAMESVLSSLQATGNQLNAQTTAANKSTG